MKRNDVIILNAKICVRNTIIKLGEKEPRLFGESGEETEDELETENPTVIFN
jgi:hypothetical protein